MRLQRLLAAAALAALPVSTLVAQIGNPVILDRQQIMKHNGELMDGFKKVVDGKLDVKAEVANAQALADNAVKLPTLFPAGSETGDKTRALSAIWSDRAGFDAQARGWHDNALKLVQAARAGDAAAFADAYRAVGGNCGGCHRNFRGRAP